MTVYVDEEMIEWRGRRWCHLVADSVSELHTFAKAIGLSPEWFQDGGKHPHYDVTDTMRLRALRFGAVEGDRRMIIRCTTKLRLEIDGLPDEPVQAAFVLSF